MNRKLAHVIGAAFVMALLAAVFSMGASAQTLDDVMYLNEDGVEQTTTATVVTPDLTEWTDGWYVINNNVTIDGSVSVTGNACLILGDQTYSEMNGIIVPEGAALTVYSQSKQDWTRGCLRTNIEGAGGDLNKGNVSIYGGQVCGEIRTDKLIVKNSGIDLCSIDDGIPLSIYANSVTVVSGNIGGRDSAICADTINISQNSIINVDVHPGFAENPTIITILDSSISGEVRGMGEESIITIENSTV